MKKVTWILILAVLALTTCPSMLLAKPGRGTSWSVDKIYKNDCSWSIDHVYAKPGRGTS